MKKFVSFLFLFLGLSVSVFASDTDDVKKYTQNLIDDAIVKIFKTGVASNERVIPFRKVLNDNFDFDVIARNVLGVYGKGISESQLSNFVKQFSELNVYSYVKKFESYTDSKIDVIDVKNGKKEGQYFVSSKVRAMTSGDKDYSVDWRIVKVGDKYKVIDVIIEGVSMVLSYRNEYAPILKSAADEGKNPVDVLTEKIEDKVIKLKLAK
ncbi:MAG: ABC transporter substrate-binding protein [Alphaproteobacteria bacterium]|nr:ABC transporter substrate-binding protein [Alphaproteobacteria bacterium]